MIKYSYHVYTDEKSVVYDGPDAADAMAAWTRALLDGDEYVTLEALREKPKADG